MTTNEYNEQQAEQMARDNHEAYRAHHGHKEPEPSPDYFLELVDACANSHETSRGAIAAYHLHAVTSYQFGRLDRAAQESFIAYLWAKMEGEI